MFGELSEESFDTLIKMQSEHWWYRARREILKKIISSISLPTKPSILEIGCGAGSELGMLSQFGNVEGVEMSPYAREYARRKSGLTINEGWLPDGLSAIEGKKFDLICMFDVLEHVEHDGLALEKAKGNLSVVAGGGGKLLVSVPAYQWLYTKTYDGFGHWRRYGRAGLRKKFVECGYRVLFAGYMNMFLFPMVVLGRLLDSMKPSSAPVGLGVPSRFINEFLYRAFALEKLWTPVLQTPFGSSLVVLGEKFQQEEKK